MFSSAVNHRFGAERVWTEHLSTTVGAAALLDAVRSAPLPERIVENLGEVVDALRAEPLLDEVGDPLPATSHLLTHQLHLGGRYPDVVVHDLRDQLFAVIEAQRRGADDQHIAKLATRYVPDSGARLGILVAERWDARHVRHPAWAACPAPVVVVLALDALHEVEYEVAWVHHPPSLDAD